jgi:hypothetical protein
MPTFILFYDPCEGNSEDWNLNYIKPELFLSKEAVEERVGFLRSTYPKAIEYGDYQFQVFEVAEATKPTAENNSLAGQEGYLTEEDLNEVYI